MSFFFNRKSRRMNPNVTFRLTQEGQAKLQGFTGDPKSQILMALETQGTSNIEEISQASGLRRGQVEKDIGLLMNGGYVQPVSASMGGDVGE